MEKFEQTLRAGWGDMDFNSHMRNTAYLDKAVDVRMLYFAANGFPMAEFSRLRIGPVVMKDEVEYFREFHLLDEMVVTFELAGAADDASRFRLVNVFNRKDGKMAARLTTTGGWLDLAVRKLVVPPENLRDALLRLTRIDDFVSMPSISA